MTQREVVLRVAWHYLGTPYIWGGDTSRGFDCSGLVIECLKSVGRFARGQDTTADGLRRMYRKVDFRERLPADLVFWMRGPRAIHVGIVLDPTDLYLGAEGGGSWATDPKSALDRNAMIKVRPLESRGTDLTRVYADPFTLEA